MIRTVLLQNSTFYPNVVGGAEMSTWILARELTRRGVTVHALASTGRLEKGPRSTLAARALEDLSGEVFEASPAGSMQLLAREGDEPPGLLRKGLSHFQQVYDRRWRRLAGEAMDRVRPDVVHTNVLVGLTTAVWEAARERGIPVVHTLRDLQLLCPRTTLQRSNRSLCNGGPLPCQLLRSWKRRHLDGVTVVTAPSRFNLEKHLEFGFFAETRREVVPNAVDGDLPESPAPGPADDTVQGLFLAQLDWHKGVPELLQALERILERGAPPRLRVAFAGHGAMQGEVEALCRRHPEQLRFHGRVSGGEKSALIRSSSYMLIPSTCHDNFPRTMLDAFMHGLPVIGARRGGIPEVVEDGVTGKILEPEPEALAEAILLYTRDDPLRRRHAGAAFARAADYTLDRQLRRFLEIYESVRPLQG